MVMGAAWKERSRLAAGVIAGDKANNSICVRKQSLSFFSFSPRL